MERVLLSILYIESILFHDSNTAPPAMIKAGHRIKSQDTHDYTVLTFRTHFYSVAVIKISFFLIVVLTF
jgi:hypothetical protein